MKPKIGSLRRPIKLATLQLDRSGKRKDSKTATIKNGRGAIATDPKDTKRIMGIL